MTKQDKELLIKDLCARLLYGVQGASSEFEGNISPLLTIGEADWDILTSLNYRIVKHGWRPFLRPMSSMTEKETKELVKAQILSKYGKEGNYVDLNNIKSIENARFSSLHNEWFCYVTFNSIDGDYTTCFSIGRVTWETTIAEIDWLNAHHFDYRGLIEKGLALTAPEGMYNFK